MSLPLLLVMLFLTIAVVSGYRTAKKSAPAVELGKLAVWWMVVTWTVSLTLTARVFLIH